MLTRNEPSTTPENMDAVQEETSKARREILNEAAECVCRRQEYYGTPENNFRQIAALWSDYKGFGFSEWDVAVMMVLLKTARIAGGSRSMDNWVDIAGYAACGGEIIGRQAE